MKLLNESEPMGMQRSKILQGSILIQVIELILGLLEDKADSIRKLRILQLEKIQQAHVAPERA